MTVYAREGVRYAWLVDPIARTLEAFALGEGGLWKLAGEHRGDARVRVAPFNALELDLAPSWASRRPVHLRRSRK